MDDYKYLALVDWVKKYITDEQMKPGDRFLTEKELCTIHNVSRQTVRQALMKLERDNIISRVRGSGTYISGTAVPRSSAGGRLHLPPYNHRYREGAQRCRLPYPDRHNSQPRFRRDPGTQKHARKRSARSYRRAFKKRPAEP